MTKKTAKAMIKVTLIKSGIGYSERQKITLLGLGLKKVGRSKVLVDSAPVRGMINKVSHLVSVEQAA
ncbi:MAG: 50S ribosomal protein L30 [Deltaproteobacteria bacterium RIFCSPLOWO2_02_FULL_53_8]|nr:MAG: 50S ribosomal protein L30 [Deltaproteobacteria bacterium RIFCSPLOWO2_02_FULL_53_8]